MTRRLSEIAGMAPALDPEITGLTADSRQVRPGILFAALPGAKADGRGFIPDALVRGAAALLVPSGTAVPDGVAVVVDPEPRRRFALMAARFFGRQPRLIVAVTGTNGKTSTAAFCRQLWTRLGHPAASLGTLGVTAPGIESTGGLTTPDPVELHRILADLASRGVEHVALEASSHGLDQHRLDGLEITAAAFTNLTRDHLDYHPDMEAYAAAKLRLFADLLPTGGGAVVNADAPLAERIVAIARARRLRLLTYGTAGAEIRLLERRPELDGQRLRLLLLGTERAIRLPLAGAFQAANALCALGLVIAAGADPADALAALETLEGVPGRLQRVARRASGAAVYVDYAHTPDALDTVLTALRPHASRRLVVVFGCGGDRDPGKRPQMGAVAARLADRVIVTDDNPRSEDPGSIRGQILAACPQAEEIGDRGAAIATAVAALEAGDVLVIAGKGHERGQIFGARVLPFDDAEMARAAVEQALPPAAQALWDAAAAARATDGAVTADWRATGISIDSRSVQPGDLFVALAGPNFDGHDFVAAALAGQAAAAMVERRPARLPAEAPLLTVADTLEGLCRLGEAARARTSARIVAITGSVGKTGTKDMLRLALAGQGETHASAGSLNNHWGVPLSLARMRAATRWGVFELGMNHAGELGPLSRLVRPHVAVITAIAPAHLAFFESTAAIADAKAEIFVGLEPGGVAVLNRDDEHYDRLAAAARNAGIGSVLGFGRDAAAEARLLDCTLGPTECGVVADLGGQRLVYRLGLPGHHWVMNSLAVLLAAQAVGANPAAAAAALAAMTPPQGRGQRHRVAVPGGSVELIDESYNANPVSARAALDVLAITRPGQGGRRIAVLGDMLELGPRAEALHAALAQAVIDRSLDLVFTAGPLMARLHDALPAARRGGHATDSAALAPLVVAALRPGDVVMVKGSAGSRMGRVVTALMELGGASSRADNGG